MSRPWMPLYIADYRNKTAHLSAAEHGGYLLLIMHYWTSGGLPNDEAQLMRIAAMTATEWRKSKDTLARFFHDGWKHERIDEELARAVEISSKRRAAAEQMHSKKDANAHANAEQMHSKKDANAHANAEQKTCNSTHTRDVIVSSLPTSLSLEETQEEQACGRKRKNKTRLPPDFMPDRDHPRKLGYSESQIDQQIEYFRDSAIAHKRVYADWQAAWRNWWKSPYLTVKNNAADKPGVMDALKRNAELLSRGIDPLGASAVGLLPDGRSERS